MSELSVIGERDINKQYYQTEEYGALRTLYQATDALLSAMAEFPDNPEAWEKAVQTLNDAHGHAMKFIEPERWKEEYEAFSKAIYLAIEEIYGEDVS
jgi:type II secretory pathway pseudopilin PulG